MFTEREIEIMLDYPEVAKMTAALKKDFKKNAVPFLSISDHDFLSLIMITPCIGVAMADGHISLKEELALNKKARKLSKGGYFLTKDPVVDTMKHLIKHFPKWESKFYEIVQKVMFISFDKEEVKKLQSEDPSIKGFIGLIGKAPTSFGRYLSTFFLPNEADLLGDRKIKLVEIGKIRRESEKLGLHDLPIFNLFCETFQVADKK